MKTVSIPPTWEQIDQLRNNIDQALSEKFKSLKFKAEIITEEILTNVAKYAFKNQEGEVTFTCGNGLIDGREAFCIEITDNGEEYNPFLHMKALQNCSIEDRSIGGVGLHLVQEMASHYIYHRIDGRNRIQIFLLPEGED